MTATPRGIECVKCGKPSEYLHDGTSPVCGPCGIVADKGPHMWPTVRITADPRKTPTRRTLIVYACSASHAMATAVTAGYNVHHTSTYVPVTSKPEGRDV